MKKKITLEKRAISKDKIFKAVESRLDNVDDLWSSQKFEDAYKLMQKTTRQTTRMSHTLPIHTGPKEKAKYLLRYGAKKLNKDKDIVSKYTDQDRMKAFSGVIKDRREQLEGYQKALLHSGLNFNKRYSDLDHLTYQS